MSTSEVVIKNPHGLHARPAAELVGQVKDLDAQIELATGGRTANAKSIMSVLALGANTGDLLTVSVDGPDAETALAIVLDIVSLDHEGATG